MSTRGEIGVWFPEEKKLRVIYNHYDSYLKGVGKDLLEDYNRDEATREILDLAYDYNLVSCPNAEYLQPRMLQFKTDYWDEADAVKQANILKQTIEFFD